MGGEKGRKSGVEGGGRGRREGGGKRGCEVGAVGLIQEMHYHNQPDGLNETDATQDECCSLTDK